MDTKVFENLESNVRSYCRSFPTVFKKALGSYMYSENGKKYIDFFAGAGALNYGHNNPKIKSDLINYILEDGITHSLDMYTSAKRVFIEKFNEIILKPKNMNYKFMFPGPTGTNAVESALKLARKFTGRNNVFYFTNAFHGMTLGALSVTGNSSKRNGSGVPLTYSKSMPFSGYFGRDVDTVDIIEHYLSDSSSGVEIPAAFILETVQAEGGVNVATERWLKRIEEVARKYNIILIVDDIQVGCGRTGNFFSFERAGLKPDIICLSKSLSGYGIPFSMNLINPEIDVFNPGEHNGTFRGHNLAFITAASALDFWKDNSITNEVNEKAKLVKNRFEEMIGKYDLRAEAKGIGLIQGIDFSDSEMPSKIVKECFENGLIIETAGAEDNVLKLLPAINIDKDILIEGLNIIENSISKLTNQKLEKKELSSVK